MCTYVLASVTLMRRSLDSAVSPASRSVVSTASGVWTAPGRLGRRKLSN